MSGGFRHDDLRRPKYPVVKTISVSEDLDDSAVLVVSRFDVVNGFMLPGVEGLARSVDLADTLGFQQAFEIALD